MLALSSLISDRAGYGYAPSLPRSHVNANADVGTVSDRGICCSLLLRSHCRSGYVRARAAYGWVSPRDVCSTSVLDDHRRRHPDGAGRRRAPQESVQCVADNRGGALAARVLVRLLTSFVFVTPGVNPRWHVLMTVCCSRLPLPLPSLPFVMLCDTLTHARARTARSRSGCCLAGFSWRWTGRRVLPSGDRVRSRTKSKWTLCSADPRARGLKPDAAADIPTR